MTKVIIYFSLKGRRIARQLNDRLSEAGLETAEEYCCMNDPEKASDRPADLDGTVRSAFERRCVLIFVGAVGIAVRATAPYVRDKLSDSPVIVIDDNGSLVIPILSGHAGGANKIAVSLASLLEAIPVITTSTDAGGAFSADVFAVENRLSIRNREGIRKVSARAIEGKSITISIKDYPPTDPVDIIIADETDREYSLLLSPKRYVIGMGMKKDTDPAAAEGYILSILGENGIKIDDVYALATIDIKEDEPAIKFFSDKYRIPVIAFEAAVLEKAKGDFASSDFVKDTVGVDNVCERSAVLAAGPSGKLIVHKTKVDGITVAIAKR